MSFSNKKLNFGLLFIGAAAIISIPLYSYAIDYTATGDSSNSSIDYTAGGSNSSSSSQVFTKDQEGLQKVIKLPKSDEESPQNTATDTTNQENSETAALKTTSSNDYQKEEDEEEVCTSENLATLEKLNEKVMEYSKNAEAAYNVAINMSQKAETSLASGDISDFRSSVENNSTLSLDEEFKNNVKLYKKCNQSPPLTAFAPAPVQIITLLGLDSF